MIPHNYRTPFNWLCPSCNTRTTISDTNFNSDLIKLKSSVTGDNNVIGVEGYLVECPNPDCLQQYVQIQAHYCRAAESGGIMRYRPNYERPVGMGYMVFHPTTPAPLSSHAPRSAQEDYAEAYSIKDLSPKASATLARRALQSMVRDFWGVSKRTLHEEIVAIKDQCDEDLYGAIMAVKSIGNIGAHPERDINLIVDVDPGEPEHLLQLLQILDEQWYQERASRQQRLARIHEIAAQKVEAKRGL